MRRVWLPVGCVQVGYPFSEMCPVQSELSRSSWSSTTHYHGSHAHDLHGSCRLRTGPPPRPTSPRRADEARSSRVGSAVQLCAHACGVFPPAPPGGRVASAVQSDCRSA